jgi:HEAT repeat protein
LDSNTGSELVVALAWRSAEIAALASAGLLLLSLLVRRYYRFEARLNERVIATWRPLLTRIALEDGEPPALPRLPGSHLPYLMEEWNALNDAVRGEASQRLNAVARQLGFEVTARRYLHSRQVGRRILGIRTLGQLRDPSSWQPLQEQLASANALVSFYAAAALVSIDAQRAMPGIMNQLAERESWPGEAMARLLVDAGADVAREPIRALMLTLAPAKIPPLLPWLSHVDAVLGSEVAIELLRRHPEDAEIAAAALLVVMDPKLLPELERYAQSPDADVRQSLAVAYGRLGALSEVEPVIRLMCDRVWWVRYRAGQALLALKGMTPDRLEAVRAQLGDMYARDMLRHVMAEASVR